jgi:hypothetical protein
MTITDIHGQISYVAMLFFLILSLWGFWRFFRKQGVDPSFWGALAIGEGIILVQSLIGAYLWIIGARPARGIHLLYGLVALAVIPTVYTYTRGQDSRADVLVYSSTTLFTVGLLFRAISTAIEAF